MSDDTALALAVIRGVRGDIAVHHAMACDPTHVTLSLTRLAWWRQGLDIALKKLTEDAATAAEFDGPPVTVLRERRKAATSAVATTDEEE